MAKEILTDDGQLEEVDMDEAKDDNKKLGLPAIDDEEGREDSEPDGEGGTKKTGDPKTKKSNASAKSEKKKVMMIKMTEKVEQKKLVTPKLKSLMLLQRLKLNQRKKKMTKITKMMRKMKMMRKK